ncbi:MAG: hypothetical protein ACF8QF_05785 [Phycisphaerales bacterium]
MLESAAAVFAITALGGAALAVLHFQGRKRSWPLAIVHLLLGATGLVLLALGLLRRDDFGAAGAAFVIFVVVALGGFILMSFHARNRPLPTGLVLVHGGAAVCAFVLLVADLFMHTATTT